MTIFGKDTFARAITETFQSIDYCLDQKLFHPALVLILSTIDAFSYVQFPNNLNQKQRFVNWVELWLLPHDEVICTALDLYAARCGWLHRLGVGSKMVSKKEASPILYCRGNAQIKVLEHIRDEMFKKTGDKLGVVRVEALAEALKNAIDNFLQFAEKDTQLQLIMQKYFENEQPYFFPVK